MYETLKILTDARGVATLTLARPDKHNAMSGKMLEELNLVAARIARDESIRVVVLAGEGRSFCAGGDLNWMKDQIAATAATRRTEARKLADALFALNTLPQPMIARVQGNSFGGGIGLMSVCDVAIGVEGAKFGLTETKLGLVPATISPYVLARMGEAKARRVFMSSRIFGADEAQILGLLAKVVPADALDAAVEAEVLPFLSCAPKAVARAKRLARSLGPVIDEAVIKRTVAELIAAWEEGEASEGIAAFFDKSKPSWAE